MSGSCGWKVSKTRGLHEPRQSASNNEVFESDTPLAAARIRSPDLRGEIDH